MNVMREKLLYVKDGKLCALSETKELKTIKATVVHNFLLYAPPQCPSAFFAAKRAPPETCPDMTTPMPHNDPDAPSRVAGLFPDASSKGGFCRK